MCYNTRWVEFYNAVRWPPRTTYNLGCSYFQRRGLVRLLQPKNHHASVSTAMEILMVPILSCCWSIGLCSMDHNTNVFNTGVGMMGCCGTRSCIWNLNRICGRQRLQNIFDAVAGFMCVCTVDRRCVRVTWMKQQITNEFSLFDTKPAYKDHHQFSKCNTFIEPIMNTNRSIYSTTNYHARAGAVHPHPRQLEPIFHTQFR